MFPFLRKDSHETILHPIKEMLKAGCTLEQEEIIMRDLSWNYLGIRLSVQIMWTVESTKRGERGSQVFLITQRRKDLRVLSVFRPVR